MRAIRATLIDVYKVHKTVDEFRKDVGLSALSATEYCLWTTRLLDPNRHYWLLMHSKKVVGMVWGKREDDGSFLVEGKFLRRAYRGKFKFSRALYDAHLQMIQGFDKIKAVLPPRVKPKSSQRMIGWLVEEGA